MRMNRAAIAAGLCLSLIGGTIAAAELPEPADSNAIVPRQGLTVADVVDQALKRAPETPLPGAYANEAAALGRSAGQLLAGPVEGSLHYQNDQYVSDYGLREWEAELSLPLWRPGQRGAQQALSGQTGQLARASASAIKLQVAGQVREAIWQLLLSLEQQRLAKQVWDTADAFVKSVKRRVETGDLPRNDLLIARDDALSKRDRYLAASQQLQDARRYYVRVTGLKERPAKPGEALSPSREIPANHPALQQVQAKVQQARARVRTLQEKGSGQPQLVIGARRERTFTNEPFQESVGIGIKVPFGGGAHVAPDIAAAQRALTEAEVEQNRLMRELELGFRNARQQIMTLRSKLSLAEQRAKNGRESLRMARTAFNVGEMDLTEFLRVQTRTQAAESDLRLRQLELKRAIAQYNQTVGVLP